MYVCILHMYVCILYIYIYIYVRFCMYVYFNPGYERRQKVEMGFYNLLKLLLTSSYNI